MTALTPANIEWRGAQAIATDYDDIYFSADGVKETERVFLAPSDILSKAALQPAVCVGELGFGTGLNFAVTAQAILARSNTNLHFVSFEKHPLSHTDWEHVSSARRMQLPIYNALLAQPLPVLPGWHQRSFAGGRITLTVFHGEVSIGLQDLCQRQRNPVDAWYLDGFAPSKNPEMWSPALFAYLAEAAASNTTVATFTAAGNVRRGLQDVGFNMRRVDQQPFKRESLAGYMAQVTQRDHPVPTAPTVIVHGAGIAGASVARQLAEQGCEVAVFDPAGIATGASGIAATLMHSRLLAGANVDAELRVSAFHYAANRLQAFPGFQNTGVLQIQGPNLHADRLARISQIYGGHNSLQAFWLKHLSQADAAALAGVPIEGEALWFPTAGVVATPSLCRALLDHPRITFAASHGELDTNCHQVICTASAVRRFPNCEHLEIVDVHGQLDWYTSAQPTVCVPIVGNGYLVPSADGCVFGASYEYQPWSEAQARTHNLELNQHLLDKNTLTWQKSARGARAIASDRNPVIGAMDDPTDNSKQGTAKPKRWLATAFGSMGTTAAPLAAAMVSARLLGWMPPVSAAIEHLTRPQRFAERQARRGIRHIELDKP